MRKITSLAIIALLTFGLFSCNGKKVESGADTTAQNTGVSDSLATNRVTDAPIHLTTSEFKKLVFNYEANPTEWKYSGDKPCIIDFWATWCPPCKAIAPILDELAKEYKGQIYIYKVDVDKEQQLAQAFGIQSIPTLLFVPVSGQPKAEVGALSKEVFKERIDNFMLVKN